MEFALGKNIFQPRHVRKVAGVLGNGRQNEFYNKLIAFGKAEHSELRTSYKAHTRSEKKDAGLALTDAQTALMESLSLLDMKELESVEKKALVLEARAGRAAILGGAAWGASIMSIAILLPSIYAATGSMAVAASACFAMMFASVAALGYLMLRQSKAEALRRKLDGFLKDLSAERDRNRIGAKIENGPYEPGNTGSAPGLSPESEAHLLPASFGK